MPAMLRQRMVLYQDHVIEAGSDNLPIASRWRSAEGPHVIFSAMTSTGMFWLAAANPFVSGSSAYTGQTVAAQRK
jgi:hypothetical protein